MPRRDCVPTYRLLRKGCRGPWWTAEELALLGTMPDEEVAVRVGRTPNAVRIMRERRGKS